MPQPSFFMKLKFLFSATLALALAARAQTNTDIALTAGVREVSLDECIQMALQHNLDVQIQRFSPWLARYDLKIAYGGYDPAFSAAGTHDYSKSGSRLLSGSFSVNGTTSDDNNFTSGLSGLLPWGMTYGLQGATKDTYGSSSTNNFESTTASASLSLTQPLLKNFWIDNTRLVISVAKNRVKYSEQSLRQQIITTVSAVETAYYELIYAQENLKVQEKSFQLASQLYSENKKRVEVGALAPLDEKQAEAQVATSRAALLTAQQAANTAQNALKTLVTDDYAKLHDTLLLPNEPLAAVSRSYNLQDSWRQGLTARPDLLQARLDLERAGIQLKYYKNQVFPQLDLVGSYGLSGSHKEFSGALDDVHNGSLPFYTYGAQLTIPLGNIAARNRYKQGKISVEQELLSIKKLEQSVMVQVDNAVKTAQAAFERVAATHEARLYAEAALEAEQKKLENGKSTSFVVLQLQTSLTTARSNEIRALADYNEALTGLAQAEASTLERRKIDVKMR